MSKIWVGIRPLSIERPRDLHRLSEIWIEHTIWSWNGITVVLRKVFMKNRYVKDHIFLVQNDKFWNTYIRRNFRILGSNFNKNTIFVVSTSRSIEIHIKRRKTKQKSFPGTWGGVQGWKIDFSYFELLMVQKASGVSPNYCPSGILGKNLGTKYRQTATFPSAPTVCHVTWKMNISRTIRAIEPKLSEIVGK